MSYILAHPYRSAFHAATVVTLFAPAAAGSPLLYLLGFAHLGPRAESMASMIQSIFGNIAARSLFAHLRSAAMGG